MAAQEARAAIMRPLISLVMIVGNETDEFVRCVKSLAGLFDELCIVITGTNPQTVEIAKSFGAKILISPWQADFAYHRNQAIALASGVWILVCDADESAIDTNFEETRYHLMHDKLPDVLLVREVVVAANGHQAVLLQPRLFRKDSGIKYIYPIHEQLNVEAADSGTTNVILLHHGYVDHETHLAKERRNIAIAREMGDHSHGLHSRARSALALGEWAEVLECTRKLISMPVSPIILVEACVLGARAAYETRNGEAFDLFIAKGREVAPHSPDIRYMELLAAAHTYLMTLGPEGDSVAKGDFVRPYVMWHDRRQVELVVKVLLGELRLAQTPAGKPAGDEAVVKTETDPH
jgi:glycosyltransferase involved in cell wall biosynthesis